MLESGGAIRCMRDPTRGGVATVVNELAKSSGVEIVIEETSVPVRNGVRAACEILGLDPLYVACEGRLVAIVDRADADKVLDVMHRHPLGSDPAASALSPEVACRACCFEPPSERPVCSMCSPAHSSHASAESHFSRRRVRRTA